MKTTRINTGIYQVTVDAKQRFETVPQIYEIEKWPDGSWLLFEIAGGSREYMQDFCTLKAAKEALL